MSKVDISQKYIQNVLSPIQKAGKIATSILPFKDENSDDVVITTNDTLGACRLCIKTKADNIKFDDEEIGILELSDLIRYINLTKYGEDESAEINRVEARTTRGNTHDCLELKGNIGKFIMPLAHEESFTDFNRRVFGDRGSDNNSEDLATFVLKSSELKEISDIGKQLAVRKVSISVENDQILLHLKGRGNNQFTKNIGSTSFNLYALDEASDGSVVYYPQDEYYEKYLPFSFEIFEYTNGFGQEFTFDIARNSSGVYALKAFGSTVPDEEGGTSDVRYSILTAINPNSTISGNDSDVFEAGE